jgi:hypothetical protein
MLDKLLFVLALVFNLKSRGGFMRSAKIALTFLVLYFLFFGQESYSQRKAQYVGVPTDKIVLFIAAQHNCPIKIEDAEFLITPDASKRVFRYRAKNVSNKAVRFFTVTAWSHAAAGGTLTNPMSKSDKALLPNQTLESLKEGEDYELVKMTREVEKLFSSDDSMKAFWVLLVDQVVFEDGTVYQDVKTSEAIRKFLEQMNN